MAKEIILRDYQLNAVEKLRENIRLKIKNQILCIATGGGKTVIAAYLLQESYNKMRRAVFVCDRISLINQTSKTLDDYGIPHGIMQAQHWRFKPWEKIQVCSAATLSRREWPAADLIIVDECHSQIKHTTDKIDKREVVTIGLSATPFSKSLGKHYDSVVNVTTTNRLMSEKFLVPFKVFAASEPDMTGAKVVAGEWTENEASSRAMPIIGDCVAEYLKHGQNKKFIAFGCNVAHATEMKKQFADAGVICELYTYREGDEFRTETVDEFRKPDSYIRGLISVSALSKGFDVSDVEIIIMCRPLKSSLSEHIQILGRGLRIHDGKSECLVLDHAGNMMRFWNEMSDFFETGYVELDDGKKKEKKKQKSKDKKVVKCPICFHIHESFVCPSCGHTPVKNSGIENQSGELKEMNLSAGVSRDIKQDFYSQLLAYAKDRGYADGWISHKYKAKFGVWPKGMKADPIQPNQFTMNWIAFSKRKSA
jgi:DNA repair protein RadD